MEKLRFTMIFIRMRKIQSSLCLRGRLKINFSHKKFVYADEEELRSDSCIISSFHSFRLPSSCWNEAFETKKLVMIDSFLWPQKLSNKKNFKLMVKCTQKREQNSFFSQTFFHEEHLHFHGNNNKRRDQIRMEEISIKSRLDCIVEARD